MRRSRFTEEQIIGVLKDHELGAGTGGLCRKQGISQQTFYNGKSKFGGMNVSEARRLRELETENGKLKKLLTDAILDNTALKDLLSKNGSARREAGGSVAHLKSGCQSASKTDPRSASKIDSGMLCEKRFGRGRARSVAVRRSAATNLIMFQWP